MVESAESTFSKVFFAPRSCLLYTSGVSDPEKKRKIIGNEFVYTFDEEVKKLIVGEDIKWLAQGTLYTDVIESGTKTAQTIKSHHNVGGLPEDMQFQLIEPLNTLFKDEVRALGIELGLPEEMVWRQPFPGPGLGIRIPVSYTHLDVYKRQTKDRPGDCITLWPL